MAKAYQISKEQKFRVEDHDPDDTSWWDADKASAKDELKKIRERLIELQELLWAEDKHRLLIVLQAMDAGGEGWYYPLHLPGCQSAGCESRQLPGANTCRIGT